MNWLLKNIIGGVILFIIIVAAIFFITYLISIGHKFVALALFIVICSMMIIGILKS